jgi:predicted nuclease of restriction endonuclease-like RecB superfamily
MVEHVLQRGFKTSAPVDNPRPRVLRAAVFGEAQKLRLGGCDVEEALCRVADSHGLSKEEARERLFADLGMERRVASGPLPGPSELALETNLALVQGLLAQSREVRVTVRSSARAIARQAHLYGLICTARASGDAVDLRIAGPAAMFRRTRMYARALGSLVPVLQASGDFMLRADVHWGERRAELRLTHRDPLARGKLPRRFDSGLEQRLAADLVKLGAHDWDLVREPEPIPVEGGLVFPDFGLRHRVQRRQVLVEVVGFWTRAYLERKLEALRAIGRHDLLVCIDAKRGVETEDVLDGLPVLAYGRRIDAHAVLEWANTQLAAQRQVDARSSSQPLEVHRLELGDLFIDFAGRQPRDAATHTALQALHPGDAVRLEREGAYVHVKTLDGVALTALSGRARQKWRERLPEIREAVVVQTVRRVRGDSAPAYRRLLRVESWRVPIIELRLASRQRK